MDVSKESKAATQVELDIERHVLNFTVRLSDGTDGKVFTRSKHKNGSNAFLYDCHLCSVSRMPGERILQTHMAGRKHQTKLAQPSIDAQTFRAPLVRKKPQITMRIAPGEPVPPGFENEVKPVSKLQAKIDKCADQALVGLEYIMELTVAGELTEPNYHCLMCDKKGDPRTIIYHITGYSHRLKFLEKHFPTVVREVHSFRFSDKSKEIMPRILQAVCEAIEDSLGRLSPSVHDSLTFPKNRARIQKEVSAEKHIDEKMGNTFVHIIDRKAIQSAIEGGVENLELPTRKRDPSPPSVVAPKRARINAAKRAERKSLDSISSISDDSDSLKKSPVVTITESKIKIIDLRSTSRSLSPISPIRSLKLPGRRPSPKRDLQMLPTPKQLAMQSSEIANERYKWEKYRCMLELALPGLEKMQKDYEKNPEKHPLYPEEWKKFWNRRYKELQAEKKDPSKHDFKPEWIVFWTQRMKDLHQEEIEKKKKEIKNKLNLPDDGAERTNDLKEQYKMKIKINIPLNDRAKRISPPATTTRKRTPTRNRSPPSRRRDRTRSPMARNRSSPSSRRRTSPTARRSSPAARRSSPAVRRSSPAARRSSPTARRSSPAARRSSPAARRRSPARTQRLKRNLSPLSDDSRDGHKLPASKRSISPLDAIEPRTHRAIPAANYPGAEPRGYTREPPPPEYFLDQWGRPVYYPPPRPMPPYYYREKEQDKAPKPKELEDNEPLTVVSVLRLLTALEELLGSLGPKVIDLLARALALEKVKANSADDMLINEDTCVIFETIKEKLKGQLIADVVDKQKIPAVKRAIKNVAQIIHQVTEKAKTAPKEVVAEPVAAADSITSAAAPAISSATAVMDKKAVAQKITTALILQGKTDVTTEQLEELIAVFMAMQEQAKKSTAPLTTASYLEEVAEARSVTTEPVSTGASVPAAKEQSPEPEKSDPNATAEPTYGLESLTDSDLQTLLQNFNDLSPDEQQHLIAYMKTLEASEPLRVEKLRKFVNLDSWASKEKKSATVKESSQAKGSSLYDGEDDEETQQPERIMYPSRSLLKKATPSPQQKQQQHQPTVTSYIDDLSDEEQRCNDDRSNRSNGAASGSSGTGAIKLSAANTRKRIIDSDDDDDDDYSYEDVFKVAQQNVKEQKLEEDMKLVHDSLQQQERKNEEEEEDKFSNNSSADSTGTDKLTMTIEDTKSLIANLMGSLQKNVKPQRDTKSAVSPTSAASAATIPVLAPTVSAREKSPIIDELDIEPRIPPPSNSKNIPFYQQQQQDDADYYSNAHGPPPSSSSYPHPQHQQQQYPHNQQQHQQQQHVQYPFGNNSGGNQANFYQGFQQHPQQQQMVGYPQQNYHQHQMQQQHMMQRQMGPMNRPPHRQQPNQQFMGNNQQPYNNYY